MRKKFTSVVVVACTILAASAALAHLRSIKSALPSLDSFPKIETIKGWLRKAAEEGKLNIPEAAQRGGRLPKSRA